MQHHAGSHATHAVINELECRSYSIRPYVVIFFEEGVVFHCSLLELQINAAAVDADYAPDSASVERHGDKKEEGENAFPLLSQSPSPSQSLIFREEQCKKSRVTLTPRWL